MSNKVQAKAKHVPERTCVACRRTDAKRGLIRLVRTPQGSVEVDTTGKATGRGAYLCRNRECWQEAARKDALARALRVHLVDADRERIKEYAEQLFGVDSAG
jgi:predicted RNA-binding protein YlxR (DUF448 family)